MEAKQPHVVIVGAGFGGIRAAKSLAQSSKVRITIIDKHNYHLFQPLLYQVSTAGLSVDDIAYPVRAMFRKWTNVEFRMAEVTGIDFNDKYVVTNTGNIKYDYLLLAVGGVTNFYGIQSVANHAFGMKTLDEAVTIRNHILQMFELATHEPDPDKRRALLTFVVVGGGPTGVESAGALSELIYYVLAKEYHHLNFREVRIMLVEASCQLLPVMPADLQDATVETLLRKHVEVRLCVQVSEFDGERLFLKGGEIIPTHTVVWAAGVRANDLFDTLDIARGRAGRAVVNEHLQVPGRPEAFVIGDAAYFEQEGQPLPMVAPVAIQQAGVATQNIQNMIHDRPLLAFRFKPVGNMATIGRNAAVVSMDRFKFKGFGAWLIWSLIHIWRLIDFRSRAVVFIKWIWDYLLYERVVRIITRQ